MEDTAVQLAIKNANDALEEKFDGKLDALGKDFHGRLDRMQDAQNKSGEDILKEIKTSNANVTQEFKAINMTTQDLLLEHKDIWNTTDQLKTKVDKHDTDINDLDEKRETTEKAMIASTTKTGMYMAAATVLSSALVLGAIGFLFWMLRAMINTPTP